MPLPPFGHPLRPLELAIRSTRALALALVAFGGLITFSLAALARGAGPLPALIAFGTSVGPGILYFFIALFLRRRQSWAVITGIVLSALYLAGGVVMLVLTFIALPQNRVDSPIILLPIAIQGLLIAALSQLIYHLALAGRSFTQVIAYYDQRGFEPLMGAAPQFPPGPEAVRPILQFPPTPPADNAGK